MTYARRWCVLSVACALLHVSSVAAAQTTKPTEPVGTGAVIGQISTGVVGTATGFVGGGLVTRWAARRLGQDEEARGRTALVGAYASATLGAAIGPALIGSRGTDKGSFPAAVGGSAAGLVTAAVLRKIGRKGLFGERGPVAIIVGAAIVSLPSIGATWAYNNTR
jgi:hypothetical protein